MIALTLAGTVQAASGLLLLALGAFVASARPRKPGNLALAVGAAASGLGWFLNNVAAALPIGSAGRGEA